MSRRVMLTATVYREMEALTGILTPDEIFQVFSLAMHQYAVHHGIVETGAERATRIQQLLHFDASSRAPN